MTAAPTPAHGSSAPLEAAPGALARARRRGLLPWLWRGWLAPHRGSLALALALMVVEGGSLGLFAAIMQPMFDRIFVAGDREAIWLVGLAVMGIFAVRAAASTAQKVLLARASEKAAARLRGDLLDHLMRLDGDFHARHPPGQLLERVQGDVAAVGQVWTSLLVGVARDLVSVVALLAVAIGTDWRWTAVALLGLPVLILPAVAVQGFVRRRARGARVAAARMAVRLDEVFHGLVPIKLNGLEAYQSRRFREAAAERVRSEVRGAAGRAAIPALVDLLTGLGFLAVLVVGGAEIAEGHRTVGEFMAFFTAMALAFEPIRRLAGLSGLWSQASASLERLRELLDARPTVLAPAVARPLPGGAPAVELQGVSLAYDGAPVLRGLSLRAEAGETTALVGASGAGKSTILHLVSRLLDPDAGRVLIGGVDVRDLDPATLRATVAVVSQDALLFDETIRENILLGRTDVPEARLRAAVEAAAVAEFADALPLGLDTGAGPRGSLLSGGQRQRVAIARALLRDAPVLLLDEATSALDARSEVAVQEALARLSAGRTTLVIAHRLSTVRAAHRIVVVDRGQVVEQGTHEELLAQRGPYAELHALQIRDTSPTASLPEAPKPDQGAISG